MPGPSGPERFSPTGGIVRKAARTSGDICPSCQRISSLATSDWSELASPAALAAYAAAPSACAPMWQMAAPWLAARATAIAAGVFASPAATPPANRRRIPSAVLSSPRANARVRAMSAPGRPSPGSSASNNSSTRSTQSAAQAATSRRSVSLSVWGDLSRITPLYPMHQLSASYAGGRGQLGALPCLSGIGLIQSRTISEQADW